MSMLQPGSSDQQYGSSPTGPQYAPAPYQQGQAPYSSQPYQPQQAYSPQPPSYQQQPYGQQSPYPQQQPYSQQPPCGQQQPQPQHSNMGTYAVGGAAAAAAAFGLCVLRSALIADSGRYELYVVSPTRSG